MGITKDLYDNILTRCKLIAISPVEVATDYEADPTEWYNVRIEEEDISTLAELENLKWYSFCRCHIEGEDGSTSREHIHALVRFKGRPTLMEFRKALQKTPDRLQRSTIFRKVMCLDHAVGVLHYMCCDRGRKPHYGGSVHLHYSRSVFDDNLLHNRSQYKCKKVREKISREAASGVSNINNYKSQDELHDFESCSCNRGRNSKDEKGIAGKKRKSMDE